MELAFAATLASNLPPDQARAVAERFARELIRFVGGQRVYIPKDISDRATRDRWIRSEHARGMSIRAIARSCELSKSRVHTILSDTAA